MKEKIRGFELIDGSGGTLPVRSTTNSAGYDFFASEDVTIPSIPRTIKLDTLFLVNVAFSNIGKDTKETARAIEDNEFSVKKPTLVKTGVKAYMQDNEFLQLANRSSNPMKLKLILSNGVGIIDSDYYNNEDNEGHIMFQFINYGSEEIIIKKGDKIGQGIFLPFLKADNDNVLDSERKGGFGSTN